MDDFDAFCEAKAAMAKWGLVGWKFEFDHARRRAGGCHHSTRTISLSHHYVERNPAAEVLDTILHEVAHAIVGPGYGHGPAWKAACRKVGARPVRCYGNHIDMPKGKLRAVCGGCLKEFRRHKRPRYGRKIWCAACGPERGLLDYRIAPENS